MMNNENGRSMVEMLGVLAIIGVLSVAGIAGYSMAMNKYRANEMLNNASQAAVLAEAKFAINSTQNASETVENATATVTAATGARAITIVGCTDAQQPCSTAKASLGTGNKIGDFTVSFSVS